MHSLERATPFYVDCYIAIRVFGMRYPAYMAQTSAWERHLYRLFLSLEAAKERFGYQRRAELQSIHNEVAQELRQVSLSPRGRG